MHTNATLFTTLYHVESILNNIEGAELEPYAVSTKGNLSTFAIDVPVTVPGVKWVIATLSGGWCLETGKGFFNHFNCRASANVGDSRKAAIIAALKDLFTTYELSDDQPEGIYTKTGSWEYWTNLIRKIGRSQLAPLYRETKGGHESLVCRYQNFLVRTSEYGTDFVDEDGSRYQTLRMITDFEQANGFLFSVEEYRSGYRAFGQATQHKDEEIHILNDVVNALPPVLTVGTVLYDTEERKFAQLIEENGEIHLQHESHDSRSTWEPFVLSSRYEVIHGQSFEEPAAGLYFDASTRYLYRAVGERPHYLVVEPAHRGEFERRSWREDPKKKWIVSKSQVELVSLEYDSLAKVGAALIQTKEGEIIADLFKRTHACIDSQADFWVGLSVEHYGDLPSAVHQVYFSLVGQFRHSTSNTQEVTEYVQTLYREFIARKSAA